MVHCHTELNTFDLIMYTDGVLPGFIHARPLSFLASHNN